MQRIVRASIGLLLLAMLVGCGAKRTRVGAVSGKITYKNQPVNGAALLLYPAASTSAVPANPITIPVTQEGDFRISDVPPGEYKIVVEGALGKSPASLHNVPPEKMAEVKAKLDKMSTPATIPFPNKYKDLRTTDLKCTITEKDEAQNLELKD